jgi:hypothetical protein
VTEQRQPEPPDPIRRPLPPAHVLLARLREPAQRQVPPSSSGSVKLCSSTSYRRM